MSHEAIVERREDEHGVRAVVTQADPVIWVHPDLLAEAAEPGQATVTGGLERGGDRLTFGTSGEGLGRLTYRLRSDLFHDGTQFWYVADREDA